MKKRDGYHHGDLRAALVAESRRTVEQDGADGLSLRAVARAVGVDIAAAYRHFRKKDDVLATVAAAGFEELGRAMAARMSEVAAAGGSSRDRFVACGTAYVAYGRAHPNLYRLMFGGRCSPEAIRRARGGPPAADAYDLLGEALAHLIDEGVLPRSARDGAELVAWAQVHGLVSLAIDGRGGLARDADIEARIERHIRVIVRGLSAA